MLVNLEHEHLDDLIDMVEEGIEFHQNELNAAVGEVLAQRSSSGHMQAQYAMLQNRLALHAKLQAAKNTDENSFAKLPEWTSEDANAAEREGWALMNYPDAPEIQKDDADPRFPNDNAAIKYVTGMAWSKDLTEHADRARRALALHYLADAYAERRRQEEA